MSDAARIVQAAIDISELDDYAGNFRPLGGGEVNDTFRLSGHSQDYVLRVTKRVGRDTLLKEHRALNLMDLASVPKEVFFDPEQPIDARMWILETAIDGAATARLTSAQFNSLGKLLAQVHATKPASEERLQLWSQFLLACRHFGTEDFLLSHPDEQLRSAILSLKRRIEVTQPDYSAIEPRLVHGDATPSNILVNDEEVGLIDWEFAQFTDPMNEFATIYYEDIDYNRGKWRIQIKPEEKQALFDGYKSAGGDLHEDRIDFWMNFDKAGAATYLHWKLHQSEQPLSEDEGQQNQHDLANLLESLKQY